MLVDQLSGEIISWRIGSMVCWKAPSGKIWRWEWNHHQKSDSLSREIAQEMLDTEYPNHPLVNPSLLGNIFVHINEIETFRFIKYEVEHYSHPTCIKCGVDIDSRIYFDHMKGFKFPSYCAPCLLEKYQQSIAHYHGVQKEHVVIRNGKLFLPKWYGRGRHRYNHLYKNNWKIYDTLIGVNLEGEAFDEVWEKAYFPTIYKRKFKLHFARFMFGRYEFLFIPRQKLSINSSETRHLKRLNKQSQHQERHLNAYLRNGGTGTSESNPDKTSSS